MDFFKREVNEGGGEDTKLVGAVVPTNIFHYFNLFCVVDKRSKSSIVRPLIEEWFKEAVVNFPEKKLIKLAAEMGYQSFKERKKKNRPFDMVMRQQERELRRKGISEEHIKTILNKIEQARRKDASERKIKSIVKKNQKIKAQYEKSKKVKE